MVAATILYGIAGVFGLIATILYIVLLVKLFQHGGVGLGILGFFCSPFTYIWGWVKSTEFRLKKIMVWLTLTLLVSAGAGGAGMAAMATSPEMQAEMEKAKIEFQKAMDEAQKQQSQQN